MQDIIHNREGADEKEVSCSNFRKNSIMFCKPTSNPPLHMSLLRWNRQLLYTSSKGWRNSAKKHKGQSSVKKHKVFNWKRRLTVPQVSQCLKYPRCPECLGCFKYPISYLEQGCIRNILPVNCDGYNYTIVTDIIIHLFQEWTFIRSEHLSILSLLILLCRALSLHNTWQFRG